MHRHLRRLERISLNPAIFFVTTCTRNRKAILVSEQVATINPRMAESMRSLWLACWTIRHNARPRASLLRPGTECWIVVSLCWLLETLEQSTNFRIAADNVRGYSTDLAARVFRSPLAFRGKLRSEMELCARESSSGATDAKCGRMAVGGRNRSAFVVAADAVRGFKD